MLILGWLTASVQVWSYALPRASFTLTWKSPPNEDGEPDSSPSALRLSPGGSDERRSR